jgi:hypothetical protein
VARFDAEKLKGRNGSSEATASALVQSRTAELDRALQKHLRRRLIAEEPPAPTPSEDALESLRVVPFH